MNIQTTMLLLSGAIMLSSCSHNSEKTREVKPVKVKTITVANTAKDDTQGYSGTIEEASGTSLSFSSIGTIKSVDVSEGQMVSQGQLIASIDEVSVQNAYDAALAAKEQALDAEKRMKQLYDAGSLTEIKWIEIQTQVRQAISAESIAKKSLADTKLYAPTSGYILQKQAEVGQSVAPGITVVKLVKIDQVKVKISVPEEEISKVRKGQSLEVSVPALGGKKFSATVTEKGVSADPLSRSYEVKGVIDNKSHELLPGMIAQVATDKVQPAESAQITLPAEIIQIDYDNKPFVWIVENSKAQKAYVTIGQNVGNDVEIVSGITLGQKVICLGQQKVSNSMLVEE